METLLKKYWRWVAAFLILVGVSFLVEVSRETNLVSAWIFVFLDDWATVLTASATLLLAIATFGIIIQNHLLQKRERIDRLLDETIEWAEEIEKFSIAPDVRFAHIQDPEERQTMEDIHWVSVLDSKARHGKVIKSRALVINSSAISQSIDDLISDLEKVSGMLLNRDCPPLVYKPDEFIKVQELNKKAIDLIVKLHEYKS